MLLRECPEGMLITRDGNPPVYEVGPMSQCDTREVRKTGKWEGQRLMMNMDAEVVEWKGRRPTLRERKHLAEAKKKGLI